MAPMSSLNRDILAVILSYLPLKNLLNAADFVCKSFHEASKHPSCWRTGVLTWTLRARSAEALAALLNKYDCWSAVEKVYALYRAAEEEAASTSMSQIRALPLFTNLHRLSFYGLPPHLQAEACTLLPAMTHLETFALYPSTDVTLTLPPHPHLTKLAICWLPKCVCLCGRVKGLHAMASLLDLTIVCDRLEEATFPASLKTLFLRHPVGWHLTTCSQSVLCSIALLPALVHLRAGDVLDSILSVPGVRFLNTLQSIDFPGELSDTAAETLTHMPNLTECTHVSHTWPSVLMGKDLACLGRISTLSRLTLEEVSEEADMSPLHNLPRLSYLTIDSPCAGRGLHHFASSHLRSLRLLSCDECVSLAPLAICANLITFAASLEISEADAIALSTLTKLETLSMLVGSEACFTHLCKLPLKVLDACQPHNNVTTVVGPLSLPAIACLAPTVTILHLPLCDNVSETVSAMCKLTKLTTLSVQFKLSEEHMKTLRAHLPRLEILRDLDFIFGPIREV